MKKKLAKTEIQDIEDIAEKAQRGQDVSKYFTGQHTAKQRVNIDFPLELLKTIDAECRRIGITRQGWVKMACDEKIRRSQATRIVKSMR
jgi:hypothetical protein